jgi:hypothetical protein
MAWTLKKLKDQPATLNLLMRPTVAAVGIKMAQPFQPGTNGYVGDAAVFGVRSVSQWAFYAVIGSTKNPPRVKIWPA